VASRLHASRRRPLALRRGDPDNGVVGLSAVSAARALIAVRGLHRFAASEGVTVTVMTSPRTNLVASR